MIKNRYILKLKEVNANTLTEAELSEFLSKYNIDIVDSSMFPKMILVESKDNLIETAPQDFKNKWSIFPERTYEVPDTKQFIKSKK